MLSILLVDDDEDDYLITRDLLSEIEGPEYDLEWISSYDSALDAIGRQSHDVLLIDYRLGQRTGLDLMREAIENGCNDPMILLTGQGGRDVDMEAMKAGAADYLVKGRIDSDLLERSMRYSIERKRAEKEREELIIELRDAMTRIKTLGGLLPICSSCKRIRDDHGYWNLLESYIKEYSDAEFSHSICPPCMKQLYPNSSLAKGFEEQGQGEGEGEAAHSI